jgi:hypothetical protein
LIAAEAEPALVDIPRQSGVRRQKESMCREAFIRRAVSLSTPNGPNSRTTARAWTELPGCAKRRIKRQVVTERHQFRYDAPPVPVDAIPIRVLDANDWVHHPATPDDIRAVLRLLPVGMVDGLSLIEMRLGRSESYASIAPARCDMGNGNGRGRL